MDFVGPLPITHSGNKYIICSVDAFLKWVFTKAIPCQTTEVALDFLLENVISIHGPPACIYSDRRSQFSSALMIRIEEFFGIKQQMTAAYHPRGNGAVERFNKTIKQMLRNYLSGSKELGQCPCVGNLLLQYNTTFRYFVYTIRSCLW